jgi:hypothetical protein
MTKVQNVEDEVTAYSKMQMTVYVCGASFKNPLKNKIFRYKELQIETSFLDLWDNMCVMQKILMKKL